MPLTTTPDRFDCDEIITSLVTYGVAPMTPGDAGELVAQGA